MHRAPTVLQGSIHQEESTSARFVELACTREVAPLNAHLVQEDLNRPLRALLPALVVSLVFIVPLRRRRA